MSLRMRLTLIVLSPLLAMATLIGFWQVNDARRTAGEVFDRSLLSAALAVSSDVAFSDGDALSIRTRELLANTSGGVVFYHVYAPDGVIVAGYATPPVGIPQAGVREAEPQHFNATYLGQSVRGVRLQTHTQIDGFSGVFTTTVWQDDSVRDAFVTDLVIRSFAVSSGLILCVALVVWFGIRLGLRPLLDLQEAIEKRSSNELSPIKRPVPEEVGGIVETLNRLFDQVSQSLSAQSEFISNAAHQLRNPIAGVLSLAEAVHTAPSAAETRTRSAEMLAAAQECAALSQKLLTLERAKAESRQVFHECFDLAAYLTDWVSSFRKTIATPIVLKIEPPLGDIEGDPTMLREALLNLVDNAQRHGGSELTRIDIVAERRNGGLRLSVSDDGQGIPSEQIPLAVERFSQLSNASGSGLGIPIVEAVATGHGGAMEITAKTPGLEVALLLPTSQPLSSGSAPSR